MTNILTKPFTDKDYADFAHNANANGQRTEQDDKAVYALYAYEELQNGQIVDISATEEYKAKVLMTENTVKKAELQSQIDELEKSQARPIRELVKDSQNAYAKTKIDNIEQKIQDLRAQMTALI